MNARTNLPCSLRGCIRRLVADATAASQVAADAFA